jgi:hypothetical protein
VNFVAELTVKALRANGGAAWSRYRDSLITACRKAPPPFGTRAYGETYRDAATDPCWMAHSLVKNAEGEGDGARHLWDLAACTPDARVAAQVKAHAIDESRHARAYVAMLDLAFPGVVDDEFHAQLTRAVPRLYPAKPARAPRDSPYDPITLDDLIQMNIAEIRTLVHHLLQRPVLLGYCAPERRRRLARVLDSLRRDEIGHIGYTAALIEESARHGEADVVKRLMQQRMSDFNAITNQDLGKRFESV